MNRLGCFFNELQGIPFGVVGEFGVPLRRAQVCMSHQLADGVKGDILAGQPRTERMAKRVDHHFEAGIGNAVVQAKDVYGLGKGLAQRSGVRRSTLVCRKKEVSISGWDNAPQQIGNRFVHERLAPARFPVDVDQMVLKVQVLPAHTQNFTDTHTCVQRNDRNTIHAAGKDFEYPEQAIRFDRRKKALSRIINRDLAYFGNLPRIHTPFDHASEYVEHVHQDGFDGRRCKSTPQSKAFPPVGAVNGCGFHQRRPEGFKFKARDFVQRRIGKKGLDMHGVVVFKYPLTAALQEWEAFFAENFPRLTVCEDRSSSCVRKQLWMSKLTNALSTEFTGKYSGIALALPADFFPDQLAIGLVGKLEKGIRLSLIASRCACADVYAGVFGLLTDGHLCLPFANPRSEMLTEQLTRRAYRNKAYTNWNAVIARGCILQKELEKGNQSYVCKKSFCIRVAPEQGERGGSKKRSFGEWLFSFYPMQGKTTILTPQTVMTEKGRARWIRTTERGKTAAGM